MKIGILTFHTPINYGAVLQAYALSSYLRKSFPTAEVKNINFKTQIHIDRYSIFTKVRKNIFKYAFEQLFILLRYNKIKRRQLLFREFVENELQLTERFDTEEKLLLNIPKMDCYIVGSDQVFHPSSPYLRSYYLDFKKGFSTKIAYAPSFGMSEFNSDTENKIKKYLLDFDKLSCREKDGAEFLSKIVGKPVPNVVDPTFLLSPAEWNDVAIKPNNSEKYIFIYDLNGGENLVEIAQEIKRNTGYKIICQTQKADAFYKVDKQVYDTGPREFIGLISNADYVITDSFHGVAFSIILKRPFYTYIAKPKASTRVRSMLNIIGLQDRIIENGMSKGFLFRKKEEVDYLSALDEITDASKKYLIDSVNLSRI